MLAEMAPKSLPAYHASDSPTPNSVMTESRSNANSATPSQRLVTFGRFAPNTKRAITSASTAQIAGRADQRTASENHPTPEKIGSARPRLTRTSGNSIPLSVHPAITANAASTVWRRPNSSVEDRFEKSVETQTSAGKPTFLHSHKQAAV